MAGNGTMTRDTKNINLQVFSWKRVQAVLQDTAWTPGADDRVFMSVVTISVILTTEAGVAQTSVEIPAYLPLGKEDGCTYTFSAGANLMVM